MTLAEIVYERVKQLPDPLAREVLDFVAQVSERGPWRDLMAAQATALADVWGNDDDAVWDDL